MTPTAKTLTKFIKKGNGKLPKTTLIFNMTSAHACPSRERDLCQLPNSDSCYALRCEKFRPSVLAYRHFQSVLWTDASVFAWAEALTHMATHGIVCDAVRFNESGDFRSQDDVTKIRLIASLCPSLSFYGYTARRDLSFARLPRNLNIIGSGWHRRGMTEFRVLRKLTGTHIACANNCRICRLCKSKGFYGMGSSIIEQKQH